MPSLASSLPGFQALLHARLKAEIERFQVVMSTQTSSSFIDYDPLIDEHANNLATIISDEVYAYVTKGEIHGNQWKVPMGVDSSGNDPQGGTVLSSNTTTPDLPDDIGRMV